METLKLSVMYHDDPSIELLKSLLEKFERQHNISVQLKTLTWNEAWAELVKVALYRDGADISEIGNTWVSDFARMAAIHAFSPADIQAIGGSEMFLPALWKSGQVYGQAETWAIPWLADTRILFYRNDILKAAGIDENGAFSSFDAMETTLEKLHAQGVKIPWVIPTGQTRMSIHHIASWVWGANGRFIAADGKTSMLSETSTLRGITRYFSLGRFLAPAARHKDDTESDGLYWSGKAVATLSGPWLMGDENISPKVQANTSYVSPPGVPFVGGSHLAVFRHCHQKREALALIQYLNSPEVQNAYSKATGLLPANQQVLTSPDYSGDDSHRQRLIERLKTGRAFHSVPLWGMVENRLSNTFGMIWNELLQNPAANVEATVKKYILPLNRRISITLKEQ